MIKRLFLTHILTITIFCLGSALATKQFPDQKRQEERTAALKKNPEQQKAIIKKYTLNSDKSPMSSKPNLYTNISAWPSQHQYHQEIVDIINYVTTLCNDNPDNKAIIHYSNYAYLRVHLAYWRNLIERNQEKNVESALEDCYDICANLASKEPLKTQDITQKFSRLFGVETHDESKLLGTISNKLNELSKNRSENGAFTEAYNKITNDILERLRGNKTQTTKRLRIQGLLPQLLLSLQMN